MSVEPAARVSERYVIVSLIGRGGMADVYLAQDSVLDRPVALKVLRSSGADEQVRQRFVAEGKILARLNHPNLVTLLDVGINDEAFLVMEYVDGPTLADTPGPIDLAIVAGLGRQLAEALACAHDAGVVHRDVKPGNVLIDADGRARLTDFGIARLLEESEHHTAEGLTVGTAAYVAPEQVTQQAVGPAADVYSLGLVLLEAITGQRAYTGPPIEAAVARLTTPPPIPDDLPVGWQRLLRQMTALQPGDRPDATAVATALRDAESGASEDRAPVVAPAPSVEVPRGLLAARLLRFAVVAAVALIVISVVLLAQQGQGVRPVDTQVPEVSASLQLPLEDLHSAVAGVGELPGLAARLDRVDTALVARRYDAAARHLNGMISWLLAPSQHDQISTAELDTLVDAVRALLAALPPVPPPTPDTREPVERGDRSTPADRPGKGKADKPGKGHDKPDKKKGKGKGGGKGR